MTTIEITDIVGTFSALDADTTYHVAGNVYHSVIGTAVSAASSAVNRTFDIEGHISGTVYGLNLGSGGIDINNTVLVRATGAIESDFGTALLLNASGSRVINNGSIFGANAINVISADNLIVNRGYIGGESTGITVQDDGIVIKNYGMIYGTQAISSGTQTGEVLKIINNGKMISDLVVLDGGNGREVLINKGTITGIVQMEAGDDLFASIGKGHVTTEVRGGTGNDTFRVNRADYALVENSGEGTDTVESFVSFTLADHFENLTLLGAADTNATGNSVNNVLVGNRGDNNIMGLDGLDRINGGAGVDKLWGGANSDTFVFRPNAGAEIVMDFTDGVDRINFVGGKDAANSIQLLANFATEANGNVILEANGTTFILKNMSLDDLTISDFIF